MNIENTSTQTKAISTINNRLLRPTNDTRPLQQCEYPSYYIPSSFNYEVALCLRSRLSLLHYARDRIIPEVLHYCIVSDNACSRRNASLHVLYSACARWNALLHVPDIACARRNASLHVLNNACARRNASLHCAQDNIVAKVCISPKLHLARYFNMSESNQVTSINRCKK